MLNVTNRGSDVYLAPTRASLAACERYSSFLAKASSSIAALDRKDTALVCSILVFDTPGAPEDVGHMLAAALKIDVTHSPVNVYWYRNRVVHCRELSHQTCERIKAINKATELAPEMVLSNAKEILASWYPMPQNANPDLILDWLVNDALAWNFNHLPKPLMADLIGKQPIEPLPRNVIDRQFLTPRITPEYQMASTRQNQKAEELLTDAICSALLSTDSKTSSSWLVTDLLSTLSSKDADSDRPRRSHARGKAAAIRSISTLNKKLERGDSAVAIVFDWALFMLEAGTARTSSGNVQMVRIYLRDLAHDLYREISKCKSHPMDLDDEDWHKLLVNLLVPDEGKTRGSAVAAFSKYLQVQLGIEAALPRSISKEVRPVKANAIWPREFQAALSFIRDKESDERLQQQLEVMLHIGNMVPIRVGELALLQLRSIRITKIGELHHLEIEIAPSRGLHPGKSKAARRVMYAGTSDKCRELMAWISRRKDECADDDHFLFGDPHATQKLFRMGRSIRVLHQSLKLATGDSSVSFHTLRHTVITRLISEAFKLGDPNLATIRLKEIADMAGHSHPCTTIKHYFHLPHVALRAAVDKRMASFFTIKGSQGAWQPVKHRTPQQLPGKTSSTGVIERLPSNLGKSTLDSGDNLEKIRKILLDISQGLSSVSISKRCGIEDEELAQVVDTSLHVTNALMPFGRTESFGWPTKNLDANISRLHIGLKKLGFDFRAPELAVHRSVSVHAAKISREARAEAAIAWVKCHTGGVLSLQLQSDYEPLLRFLKDANVPRAHLVVRTAASTEGDERTSNSSEKFIQGIRAVLGADISLETVSRRRGRPQRYLLLARRPVFQGGVAPSAVCRMAEIHAVFAVCAVSSFNERGATL